MLSPTWLVAALCLVSQARLLAQTIPTMFPPVRGTREMIAAANTSK